MTCHLRPRWHCPVRNRPIKKTKIMNYRLLKSVHHNDPNHPAKYGGLGFHSLKVSFQLVNGVSLIFKSLSNINTEALSWIFKLHPSNRNQTPASHARRLKPGRWLEVTRWHIVSKELMVLYHPEAFPRAFFRNRIGLTGNLRSLHQYRLLGQEATWTDN